MKTWIPVTRSKAIAISIVKKLIPDYSYEDDNKAHSTDEAFSNIIVENLRVAKDVMFNSLETAYSLHRELLLKDLESLRDEMDTFSDEVKARAFKWDPTKNTIWLEKLVSYDTRILHRLGKLIERVRGLHNEIVSSSGTTSQQRIVSKHSENIKQDLDEIEVMFWERDAVCNINEETREEMFEEIRQDIRKRI